MREIKIERTFLERADYSIFDVKNENRTSFIPLNNERTLYEIEFGDTNLKVILKGEQENSNIVDSIKNEVDILIEALKNLMDS